MYRPERFAPEERMAKALSLVTLAGDTQENAVEDTLNNDRLLLAPELALGTCAVFDALGAEQEDGDAATRVRSVIAEKLAESSAHMLPEQALRVMREALWLGQTALCELRGPVVSAAVMQFFGTPGSESSLHATIGYIGNCRVVRYRPGSGSLEHPLTHLTLDDAPWRKTMKRDDALMYQRALARVTSKRGLEQDQKLREFFDTRHIVTQCLGESDIVIHTMVVSAQPYDQYLLMTNGIHNNLTDIAIASALEGARSPGSATNTLIRDARICSRHEDNIRRWPDEMTVGIASVNSASALQPVVPVTTRQGPKNTSQ